MSSWQAKLLSIMLLAASGVAMGDDTVIGHAPSAAAIKRLDIDVRADGKGLPDGQGTASEGEILYDQKCASCHGTFGEGEDRFPALAGGQNSLQQDRPQKTVGSFWPYGPPLFDYTYRTMPFGDAQSMSANETYAIIAYVLSLNDLLNEDTVLDKHSLSALVMPNVKGFKKAPAKPDTPQLRCMKNCKNEIRVHSRAGALGVTPDEGGTS